jgi:transposase-like protein
MKPKPQTVTRPEAIKILMKRMGLTLDEIAKECEVSISTVFWWREGITRIKQFDAIDACFKLICDDYQPASPRVIKACLTKPDLTMPLRDDEYRRLLMTRNKTSIDKIAQTLNIDRNYVYQWSHGIGKKKDVNKIIENNFSKVAQVG